MTLRRLAAFLAAPIGGTVVMCSDIKKQPMMQSWPSMSLPEHRSTKQGDRSQVDGVLNYQAEDVVQVVTRRDASGSDDVLQGANWDKRSLLIKDGRKVELTLQKNGFQLTKDPKPRHVDYYDEVSVISRYYHECEELLQQATGAKLVRAFDHNVGPGW